MFLKSFFFLLAKFSTRKIQNYLLISRWWGNQWCSGYHICIISFSKLWTQVLLRFKFCWRRVSDLRCGGSRRWSWMEISLNGFRRSTIPQNNSSSLSSWKRFFFFLKTSKFSNFEPSHIVSLHIFSDRTRWPVGCLDLNLS